ncbi:MAG: flagellin, partial [Oscillospiraceae bacterium]|nr:flagellin [Oscillospiraceae bacterium]
MSTAGTGKPLTLQIGDTSESFNQMDVNVKDMHTTAMGTEGGKSIADINIGTQEGASEAINVIKDAINYVSSVRGDLGAVQNRLEHTQNNLSVMAENIQDAESTIRDTDVAE